MFPKIRKYIIMFLTVYLCLSFLPQLTLHVSATKGSYPGANGLIAFSDYDPAGSDREIFIMNSDGSGVKQLTFNGMPDNNPCWSPDGNRIAFDGPQAIWVINMDGTGLRQVTFPPAGDIEDSCPAWSPDGDTILFLRYKHTAPGYRDIYKIDANSSGAGDKLIEQATGPSWSPDGSMIAYWNISDNNVWVADSGTGAPLFRVTSDEGYSPCWSPDGQWIVYAKEDRIYVIKIDGSNNQQISNPPFDYEDQEPNWSPDGTKIIFHREEDSIWVVKPDGTGAYDLTPSMPDASEPDWQATTPIEPPVGGDLLPQSSSTIASWLIAGISTIALSAGIVLKKKKLS